ncbi:MAG: hypothetical protein ACI8R4_000259 [Paracoccaceae bacterium]|jgi:hypothetical protein
MPYTAAMKILALSGSGRHASANTAMLRCLPNIAPLDPEITPEITPEIVVFHGVSDLPVFSPDLESGALPETVQHFANLIRDRDGVIVAKPIAPLHASHRGDDIAGAAQTGAFHSQRTVQPGYFPKV